MGAENKSVAFVFLFSVAENGFNCYCIYAIYCMDWATKVVLLGQPANTVRSGWSGISTGNIAAFIGLEEGTRTSL